MTMLWSNLRDGNPITRHTLNFEIPLPQSTVTKLSFSDKALLRTLVLEMHEQGMSYRESGRASGCIGHVRIKLLKALGRITVRDNDSGLQDVHHGLHAV